MVQSTDFGVLNAQHGILGKAADLIGVSPATLRRYAKQFKKLLSQYAWAKRRQYTQSNIATLTRAKTTIRGGNTTARTNIILGVMGPSKLQALPVAAAMSHAEIVSAFQVVGEQFAIMQDEQAKNTEQIAALAARQHPTQAADIPERRAFPVNCVGHLQFAGGL